MKSPIHWLVLGFALAACSARALVTGGQTLRPGPWGGDQVALEVAAAGAVLEFECAEGKITESFKLDDRGDFDLPGTFIAQGPGPSRDGDSSASPARYKGQVRGDTMTLTVFRGDQQLGPYTLTRDRRPILKKCR
jgi:hypothetical protein